MPTALWIGFFRFQGLLAGGGGESPALVLREGVVWDANTAAAGHGIQPGCPAATARTLCPEASCRTLDPAMTAPLLAQAWDLLAAASGTVEPDGEGRPEALAAWAAADPPLAETAALAASCRQALPAVRLAAGLAQSRLLACAACPEGGGRTVVSSGTARRLLSALPLTALVAQGLLAPAACRRLRELDLHHCGQIAALPEAALRARFGPDGRRLHALCLGQDARPVRALYPPRILSARRTFPDGLPPAALPAAGAALARKVAGALGPTEGARRLVLQAGRDQAARDFRSPRREPELLARAAATLAGRLAGGDAAPPEALTVRLEDICAIPITAQSLLAPLERVRQTSILDDLLERLPRGVLRRGALRPDRYAALLAQLDPWKQGGAGAPAGDQGP